MNLLAAFVLAAPLVLTNSTENGYNFVVKQLKPALKKPVKVRMYKDDEFDTKLQSTSKTSHRVQALDSDGKVIACAIVSNAGVLDLVQTPNGDIHFVCTGGDVGREMVACRLSHCDPK